MQGRRSPSSMRDLITIHEIDLEDVVVQPANLKDIDLDVFSHIFLSDVSRDEEAEDAIFACTDEECLHGTTVDPPGPTRRGNWAWVVFNGRGCDRGTSQWLSELASERVVTGSTNPGVYCSRAAASVALGSGGPRRLIKAGSRGEAERAFTQKYMRGDIVKIYTE
ncbi:hypothetical protein L208DRAFT_1378471 [Tricholoma matsutake]|nr:hypothetical protein L208DRAFT_1378471 [Tricholoma matsutake 945]